MIKALFLMLLTVTIFSSCKKSQPIANQTHGCKIKSFEAKGYPQYYTDFFTYDDNGRVIRTDRGSKESPRYITFTYESDKILVNDAIYGSSTYDLDAEGRIVKQGRFAFKYNNKGYLIESAEIVSDKKNIETYSYENENLIAITSSYQTPVRYNTSVSLVYTSESSQDMSIIASSYHPQGHLFNLGAYGELLPFFGKLSGTMIGMN